MVEVAIVEPGQGNGRYQLQGCVILTLAGDCESEPQLKNDQLFLLHDFPPQ
jgi:hypothetical protein